MDSQGAKTADESSAPAALWRRGADLWDVKGHVDRPAKRVPVVEDGKLKGIVSRANIIQALVAVKETGLPETDASDQEIREAVMAEFDRHAWSGSSTINVVVKDGVVRLWGLVGSEDARKAVHLAAESIDGVKSIEDNLSVADRVPDHF